MKRCSKEDCLNEVISRGKYCEDHRRKRKIIPNDDEKLNQLLIEKLLVEDERRDLVSQQEKDYFAAMQMDIENMSQKQREIDRKVKIRQKFQGYLMEDGDMTLQFTFPEYCTRVKQHFRQTCVLHELFDFVDVFIEDSNFKITDYQLVVYPNRIFTKKSDVDDTLLSELSIIDGLCLFVQKI